MPIHEPSKASASDAKAAAEAIEQARAKALVEDQKKRVTLERTAGALPQRGATASQTPVEASKGVDKLAASHQEADRTERRGREFQQWTNAAEQGLVAKAPLAGEHHKAEESLKVAELQRRLDPSIKG